MAYPFDSIKSDVAFAEALQSGKVVKLPAANELFIDVDGDPPDGHPDWFAFNWSKIEEHIPGGASFTQEPSPSGEAGHYHIVVTLSRDVEPMERILLQAILGSDLQREALSWVRIVNGDPHPTLFFEKAPLALPAAEPLALLTDGLLEDGSYPF